MLPSSTVSLKRTSAEAFGKSEEAIDRRKPMDLPTLQSTVPRKSHGEEKEEGEVQLLDAHTTGGSKTPYEDEENRPKLFSAMESDPIKNQQPSKIHCGVDGCPNSNDNPRISLYPMPSNPEIAAKWRSILRLQTDKQQRICSAHFPNKCFIITKLGKILKENVLPVEFNSASSVSSNLRITSPDESSLHLLRDVAAKRFSKDTIEVSKQGIDAPNSTCTSTTATTAEGRDEGKRCDGERTTSEIEQESEPNQDVELKEKTRKLSGKSVALKKSNYGSATSNEDCYEPYTRTKSDRRYCSVSGCRNSTSTPDISMHYLPDIPDISELWRSILKLKPSKRQRICSAHFHYKCFTYSKSGKRHIKSGMLPLEFTPESTQQLPAPSDSSVLPGFGAKKSEQDIGKQCPKDGELSTGLQRSREGEREEADASRTGEVKREPGEQYDVEISYPEELQGGKVSLKIPHDGPAISSENREYHNNCSVKGCLNKSQSPGITMHRMPKTPEIAAEWRSILGLKSSDHQRVCSVHFPEKCFSTTKTGRRHLVANALPVEFTPEVKEKSHHRRHCAVVGCPNGTYTPGISMHTMPAVPDTAAQWRRILKLKPFKNHSVCSAHFSDGCFHISETGKRMKRNALPVPMATGPESDVVTDIKLKTGKRMKRCTLPMATDPESDVVTDIKQEESGNDEEALPENSVSGYLSDDSTTENIGIISEVDSTTLKQLKTETFRILQGRASTVPAESPISNSAIDERVITDSLPTRILKDLIHKSGRAKPSEILELAMATTRASERMRQVNNKTYEIVEDIANTFTPGPKESHVLDTEMSRYISEIGDDIDWARVDHAYAVKTDEPNVVLIKTRIKLNDTFRNQDEESAWKLVQDVLNQRDIFGTSRDFRRKWERLLKNYLVNEKKDNSKQNKGACFALLKYYCEKVVNRREDKSTERRICLYEPSASCEVMDRGEKRKMDEATVNVTKLLRRTFKQQQETMLGLNRLARRIDTIEKHISVSNPA